jgi:hypothetical protein
VTVQMGCRLIGRWRIVEADIWERDYLDLVEPSGSAELLEDGTLEIELDYHHGDEAILARRTRRFFNNLLGFRLLELGRRKEGKEHPG